jgi:hypothetical protein
MDIVTAFGNPDGWIPGVSTGLTALTAGPVVGTGVQRRPAA